MTLVQEEVPVLEELPEVKKIKLKGATIKVKPDMDLDDIEEALNEALVDEGEETPDQWYYETSLVIKKYWVQIEGDTLKLTGINTNFKSLKDYIEDGHKSVKIGINRKIKETLGNVISTSVEKSVSVDFVDSAKITKEGLSSHGREVAGKEIPKSVKFGSDISFAILPEDGYVPTVKYAVGDEDEGESKELEADEISKGEYSYTIDGDEVEDDIRITVSYSKTVARKVDIQTEGGTVSVNGREQKNSETVAVTKKNCEIKIQPQPGYAIESIQAGDDEIALNNQDFEKYAYIYKVDEDSVTADAEPLKLKVTVKKVELAAKAGTRQVQWLKGFSQPDDKLEDALKDAIIDVKKTYPDLEETDGEIKVEYLARDLGSLGKNYKELDYEPEGISGLGVHKFGENSKVDEEGNPIENVRISLVDSSRYPDAAVEADVVLKDIRELAKFTVNASSIRYTTDADQLKQELYDRIVWENGEKPEIGQFTMQIKTEILGIESYKELEKASVSDLSVGTKTFKVIFNGNETFRENEAIADIEIIKAKASVSVKNKTITYGEEIPSDLVTVVPSDAGVLKIYAGVNSDLAASVCVQLPPYLVNLPVVGDINISESLEKLLGESVSLNDLLEKLNSTEGQALLKILQAAGVDTDTFVNAFQTISQYLPDSVKSFKVTFGAPEKAGGYTVVAAVVDPNYEASVGVGSLIILPKTENVELRWNQEISVLANKDLPLNEDGTFNEEKTAELFGAKLYDKESNTVLDSSKVRYLYVGMDGEKEFYRGSTPSSRAGVYTQTAYVLNGDNMNWPIVRTYVVGRASAMIQFKDAQMENAPIEDAEYGNSDTKFAVKRSVYNGAPQTMEAGLYLAAAPQTEIEGAELAYRYYDVKKEAYVDAPVNAGIYRVTASFCGNGSYSDTAAQTGYLIIEKAQPVLNVEAQQSFTYNGEAHAVVITSIEQQDPETEPSISYKLGEEEVEAPIHAGVYTAAIMLPETANYQAASVEAVVTIVPAKANVEIHPVVVTFDGQAHKADYSIQGVADEAPDHVVSYSVDGETYTEEEPIAAGSYAVQIHVTDSDYEDDVICLEGAVLIKEEEVIPEIAEARLYIRYLCDDQTVGYQLVKAEGESGSIHVFNKENVTLEIPAGYKAEAELEEVTVRYGEEAEITVRVKRSSDQGGDNKPENPGDNGNNSDSGNSGNNGGNGSSSSSSSRGSRASRGVWRQDERGIWYSRSNGSYPKNEWCLIGGKWFHFDAEGYLTLGWFLSADGNWYYCNPNGTQIGEMFTGWLQDSADGYWYYLDPVTGAMATGWKEIDGKWYYFNEAAAGESGWAQDPLTTQWVYIQKGIMPKGALYTNMQTPDGYFVDVNGVRQ